MTNSTSASRRSFLKLSTATAASLYVSGLSARETRNPLEKLNIACIGTANRARADINGVVHENIVALCDVDTDYLGRCSAWFKEKGHGTPSLHGDYRDMLADAADSFDAVVVGTTDHHHAPATIRALRAGKHVYCEKPLTHTVAEARLIAETAKEMGVATQMGTQIHAEANYRRCVEIIQGGVIGDVTEAHVWVNKAWGGGDLPKKADPVPKTLDWDMWLGPAPERPFAAGRYHPANWRRWWDFGQGTLGDMACHYMDLPFWALKLRHPTHCQAKGAEVHPETCPLGLIVEYDFPARDDMGPVKLTWYDGDLVPKKINGQPVPANGIMFVGTDGMMFASYSNYRLFPADKFSGFTPPEKSIPDSIGHHNEWIKACKDGSPTTCNFNYSGALTETVLLGNVAYRSGEGFDWDGKSLTPVNASKAARYVTKEYRSGWEVV
jgi:predicted dehydrogenase